MDFAGADYLAILLAAVASMIAGAVWYRLFAKQWIKAAGFSEQPKQDAKVYVVAMGAQLIMASMLLVLFSHFQNVGFTAGLVSGFFLWLGFCAAPMAVNHRFQSKGWDLTIIDSGYWLVVFLLQGGIIGRLGG